MWSPIPSQYTKKAKICATIERNALWHASKPPCAAPKKRCCGTLRHAAAALACPQPSSNDVLQPLLRLLWEPGLLYAAMLLPVTGNEKTIFVLERQNQDLMKITNLQFFERPKWPPHQHQRDACSHVDNVSIIGRRSKVDILCLIIKRRAVVRSPILRTLLKWINQVSGVSVVTCTIVFIALPHPPPLRKQNVVSSRRTHHKHETAPLSLYNRQTITLCLLSGRKSRGQKIRQK